MQYSLAYGQNIFVKRLLTQDFIKNQNIILLGFWAQQVNT